MLKRVIMAAAALSLAVAMGSAAQAQEKLKVGFINVGPKNDGGWTQGHWTAAEELQKELGDQIEITFVENVKEGADSERAIEALARAGNKLIFTTSFGFMDPTINVAKRFPDVKFEHATGFKTAENVTSYNARFYEGRYIIGQIAAKLSKTGTAGYIVSVPIPEVVMGINSFMLGAQSINPDFKIKIVWIDSWMDPAKEADAAKTLFDQGVDIITQHTDSSAPLQIAQERGLLGFGQAHDMYDAAPKAQLTAITDNWAPYYIARTKAVLDGTWKSQASWDGLKEGLVKMSKYTNMPDDVAKAAEEMEHKISEGTFHPFTGPIYDQEGTERYAAGVVAPDADLLGMNWYVKGIDDKVPQ